jgi:hypothetical protein
MRSTASSRAKAPLLLLAIAMACAARSRVAPAPGEGTPGAVGSPLEVTRAFYGALHAGDADGAARLVASPNADAATASFVKLAKAYEDLERALRDRFGPEAAHAVGYADRVAAEDDALRAAEASVRDDEALVTAGDHTLATLRRVGGAWRVVLEDALTSEQGLRTLVLEADSARDAAERVAPAIRGGLYDGPEDALEAFRSEMALRIQGEEPDLPGSKEPSPEGAPGPVPL